MPDRLQADSSNAGRGKTEEGGSNKFPARKPGRLTTLRVSNEAENGESQLQTKRDRLTTLSEINAAMTENLAPKTRKNIWRFSEMKKILVVFLAFAMMFAMTVPAMSEGGPTEIIMVEEFNHHVTRFAFSGSGSNVRGVMALEFTFENAHNSVTRTHSITNIAEGNNQTFNIPLDIECGTVTVTVIVNIARSGGNLSYSSLRVSQVATSPNPFEVTERVEPTCTEDGFIEITCSGCEGVVEFTLLDKLGHDYDAVDTPMTPEDDGFTTYTCKREDCGHSYVGDYVDCVPYDWQVVDVIDPTCTEQGYTIFKDYYWDAEKNDSFVPALGHDYGDVVTLPTCTQRGFTTYICARDGCGKTYRADFVRRLGHDYVGEVTDPTCEDEGFTTYTCTRCDDEYVDDIEDAFGHTPGERKDIRNPNCTDDGAWEIRCDVCEKILESGDIDALGHTPGERKDILDPTCTEKGTWEVRCEVCNEVLDSGDIDALGHTPGERIDTLDPTCTAKGAWEIRCEVCDVVLDSGEIDALGHDPGERVDTLDPTCTAEGAWEIRCEICDALLESGDIDALGHTPGERKEPKDSTCTAKGAWIIRCKVCNVVVERGRIDAKGHTPGERIETLAPTCTGVGAWEIRCEVCDVVLDSGEIAALGHTHGEETKILAPTCTGDGAWEVRCTVCGVAIDSGNINALGHDWKEVTVAPTCTLQGYTTNVCDNDCGAVYGFWWDYTDPLGHLMVLGDVWWAATCKAEGQGYSYCSVCDWGTTHYYPVKDCNFVNGVCTMCGEKEPVVTITNVANAKFISIAETAKNSRVWRLTFSAGVTYSNGFTEVVTYSIDLAGNNANLDGKFTFGAGHDLAGRVLTYDIKGNGSNIKAFGIK